MHGDGFAIEAEAPGTVVLIDAVGCDEFFEPGVVDGDAFALEVGAEVSAFFGAFIPIEAEPVQAVEDSLACFVGVSCFVGVFDAEDEGAAVFSCEEPVEERGSRAADVEVAGGRWCEAGANGHGGLK